jgi:hypothetical protein
MALWLLLLPLQLIMAASGTAAPVAAGAKYQPDRWTLANDSVRQHSLTSADGKPSRHSKGGTAP